MKSTCQSFFPRLIIAALLAWAAVFRLAATPPARAQPETVVQVTPETAEAAIGATAAFSLEVLEGVDVNAYDVTITYDPAVAALVSWSQGDYLSNLAQVYKVDEPGRLRLVFTQLATPPVSGDGVLLNLVFRGAAAGTSPVTIESLDFAGSNGSLYHPRLISGTLVVLAAPAASLTPTTAPAASLTSTPTPAASATTRPTASPRAATATRTPITALNPGQGAGTPAANAATTPADTLAAAPGQTLMRGVTVFVAAPPKNASQPAAALPLDAASAPDDASAADRLYGTLNLALWGLLALFLLIFVWMVFTAIRRAKTKSPPKEFH